ncbi:MAG: FAD-binding protein [Gammaproteobacteria bacterium]|nr:FAD-binding protein [Gammaproteobacteria bacterium]
MSNKSLEKSLVEILGRTHVKTEPADIWSYGLDNSRRHALADFVVLPETTEQVRQIVALCNRFNSPLIARGKGTGTTGATVPITGGVILSTERMNKILRIAPNDRYMVVQPGVTNEEIQIAAAEHGFFWPPDPTSAAFCTVGGNLAYNSAGPRAVKYGTPRENTLGLEAVSGAGNIMRCGVYTTKGVVGYDLTRLLIGSEGTLAIITEATLKLTPLTESKSTIKAIYKTIDSAAQAVSKIMAQSTTPCSLEFMDKNALNMVRQYSKADLPEDAGAMLMIEVDGKTEHLQQMTKDIGQAAQNDGLELFTVAHDKTEVKALWETRKALSPSLRHVAAKKINEDVVVPVSNIPKLINGLEKISNAHQIPIVNFGHAGNGNIHVNLLVQEKDEAAYLCLDDVFKLVLSLNGSLSGEHGVGIDKLEFIASELDKEALAVMHLIKQAFDPKGILNPGKTIPAEK